LINAAAEWERSGRDTAELYRGARLAAALDWAESHDPELNELERAFLDESRAASERETERQRRTNRRLRTLLAGAGVLLAAAVIGGVIAVSQRQEARSAARAEAAQRLGAQALTEDRPDQALRFAAAGVALDDSVATRSNLLSILLRSPAMLKVLPTDGENLGPVALSPDGGTLAVGDERGTVTVFDTAARERIGQYRAQGEVAGGESFIVDFSPRGDSIAVGVMRAPTYQTGEVQVVDARTLRLRTSVPIEPNTGDRVVTGGFLPLVTYSPGGRSLVVGYSGEAPVFVRRFDVRTSSPIGRAARISPGLSFTVAYEVQFEHPSLLHRTSNQRLVYADPDATYVIDAQTLRVLRRYPVGAYTTGISPDGATLALGGLDGSVRLLDLNSGRVRRLAQVHNADVTSEAFSPDGRTLATGDNGGTVVVWDLKQERKIETLNGHIHEGFAVKSGGAIETLEGHTAALWGSAFSPDGRTLYTASDDSNVIIWDLAGDRGLERTGSDPGALVRRACAIAGGGLTPEQWEAILPRQDYVSTCPSG
jgi:WD40 repeat protein